MFETDVTEKTSGDTHERVSSSVCILFCCCMFDDDDDENNGRER